MANITIATPFSGRMYCFYEYRQSLIKTIREASAHKITVVFYNNANSKEFTKQLKLLEKDLETLDCTIINHKDTAKVQVVLPLDDRMFTIYAKIYNELVPTDTDYILNIEDDIAITFDNAIDALIKSLKSKDNVLEVSAGTYSRRVNQAQAWNKTEDNKLKFIKDLEGLIECDCVSQSYTLIDYKELMKIGFSAQEDGLGGVDRAIGLRGIKNGYKVLYDFTVLASHYGDDRVFTKETRKDFVNPPFRVRHVFEGEAYENIDDMIKAFERKNKQKKGK